MGEWVVNVRVLPNSKRNSIELTEQGYKIHLCAPAVEGKANKALITFLAKSWGLKKREMVIVYGDKSRNKRILISRETIPDIQGLKGN